MDLSKLPPFIAMSLGLLGCVAEPCLSLQPETESGTSSGTGTGTSGSTETTMVGPCLGQQLDTSSTTDPSETFTTSACLSPPEPETDTGTTGTGTDTGTGTGTDSGTDGGSDTGTTGAMLDEPQPTSRAAAVARVLARGTLPPDVAARLRDRSR